MSMTNRRMSLVAGLLMLAAGLVNITFLTIIFTRIVDPKEIIRVIWVISPFPYVGLAIGFGGNVALSNILAVIYILGILLSIIGSVFVLRRMAWGLSLIGSVGTLICIPLLGIAAIVLILMIKCQA